jgi:CRISPR/Cas system CSM-associated protein Csm2 small subunit
MKLQNSDIKINLKKNIAQKLIEINTNPDREVEWDNLKNIVNDVAYDEVGIRINTKSAGWYDEDCRKAIKAKMKQERNV